MNQMVAADLQTQVDIVKSDLMSEVEKRRRSKKLSHGDVALLIGRNRMTVQRAEACDSGLTMTTFLQICVALGMTPTFENGDAFTASDFSFTDPADVVHQGLHHERIQHDSKWRDRQREAALAKSWEAANEFSNVGLSPIMNTLVPGHTQAQATAAATVMQWLGSDVGFDFLARALANAGYEIVDTKAQKRPR